jgi:hypothetical protein
MKYFNVQTGQYEENPELDLLKQQEDEKTQTTEMDPVVKNYIAQKLTGRKQAEQDYNDRTEDLGGLQFLAGVGDAIAGRNPSDSAKNFQNLRNNIKEDTLGAYDQKVKAERENKQFQREDDLFNPNSAQSIAFRKSIEANFPKVAQAYGSNWANITASDQDALFKPLQLKENIEARKEQARILSQQRQDSLNLKREELLKKNSPDERQKNLSSTDKARFDNALMVLKGIDEMGSALDNGDNTFSMVGDNNYTAAERRATEAYGRMQSGGAINKDEEKRFSATLPGSRDNKEMQRKKLIDQRNEMISRLKTLGFTPEQIGYEPRKFNYGSDTQNNKSKPKTITQNGHTYTLNESTGDYE